MSAGADPFFSCVIKHTAHTGINIGSTVTVEGHQEGSPTEAAILQTETSIPTQALSVEALVDDKGQVSPEFAPLTMDDVESLRAARHSDDYIRQVAAGTGQKAHGSQAAKMKVNLATLLAEKRDWLLEQSGGKQLFAGRTAGTMLIAAGLYHRVRGFNAIGDKFGGHGFDLPSVVIDGKRRYDITFIGRSAEEKAVRQAYLDRASLLVLRELVAEAEELADETEAAGELDAQGEKPARRRPRVVWDTDTDPASVLI
jgi:hypothetical protein